MSPDALYYYKKKDTVLAGFQGAVPLNCVDKVIFEQGKGKAKLDIVLFEHLKRSFSFQAYKSEDDLLQCYKVLDELLKKLHADGKNVKVAADGAFWKNKNKPEVDKKAKKDQMKEDLLNSLKRNGAYGYDLTPKQLKELYTTTTRSLYTPITPIPKLNMFENLSVLAETIFGGYHIQLQEQNLDLGQIYILGDQNYNTTHKSYLLHCTPTGTPFFGHALTSIDLLSKIGPRFPLFPQQLHCGGTSDAVYAVYHPPLRSQHDSLFSWLPKVEKFPEYIVAFVAVHVVLTLEFLHLHNEYQVVDESAPNVNADVITQPIQFPTLSPETIFFDTQGQVRVCDLFLNPNPTLVNGIPEYLSPESLCHDQPTTIHSDFWRLGVLLYELSAGIPPFRPGEGAIPMDDPTNVTQDLVEMYRNDVKQQLDHFTQTNQQSLPFPPFVSTDLQDLILAFLQPDPQKRLCNFEQIKQHPWFVTQLHLINALLSAQCNEGRVVIDEQEVNDMYNRIIGNPTLLEDETMNAQLRATFWNVHNLVHTPRLPWLQENIMTQLLKSDQTPINLTFQPPPVSLQRLTVQVLKVRNLLVTTHNLITLDQSGAGSTNLNMLNAYGLEVGVEKDKEKDKDKEKERENALRREKELFSGAKGGVSLLTAALLPKLNMSITVEGEVQKLDKVITVIPANGLGSEIGLVDKQLTFDLLNGDDLYQGSDAVIELYIQHGATTGGANSSGGNGSLVPASLAAPALANIGSSLLGTITGKEHNTGPKAIEIPLGMISYPLNEIKEAQNVQSWFVLYDYYGQPVGEVEIAFSWENEDIPLDTSILAQLTDGSKNFLQEFAKQVPPPPRKMWTQILDISALAMSDHQQQQEDKETRTAIATIIKHAESLTSSGAMPTPLNNQQGANGIQQPVANPNMLPRGTIVQSSSFLNSSSGGTAGAYGFATPSLQAKSSIMLPMSPILYGNSSLNMSTPGGHSPTPSHGGLQTSPSNSQLSSGPMSPISYQPRPSQSGLLLGQSLNNNSSLGQLCLPPQANSGMGMGMHHSGSMLMSNGQPGLTSGSLFQQNSNEAPPPIPPLPPPIPPVPDDLPGDDVPPLVPPVPPVPLAPQSQSSPHTLTTTLPATHKLGAPLATLPQQPASPTNKPPTPQAPLPTAPGGAAPVDPYNVRENWRKAAAKEEDGGGYYYYNKVTKHAVWDPPECLLDKQ